MGDATIPLRESAHRWSVVRALPINLSDPLEAQSTVVDQPQIIASSVGIETSGGFELELMDSQPNFDPSEGVLFDFLKSSGLVHDEAALDFTETLDIEVWMLR